MKLIKTYFSFFLSGLFAILFCILVFLFLCPLTSTQLSYHVLRLDDNWSINYNGTVEFDQTLPEYNIRNLKKNDNVQLTTTLPKTIIPGASLLINYDMCYLRVYLDNELIYSYGSEFHETDLSLSLNRHLVYLPHDYAGKRLRIILIPRFDRAFSTLSYVYLGNYHDLTLNWLKSIEFALYVGIFLTVFGAALFIMFPYYLFFHPSTQNAALLISGLLSSAIGIYILTYHQILYILTGMIGTNYVLNLLSLYLWPLLITLHFYFSPDLYYKKMMLILCIVNALFFSASIYVFVNGTIPLRNLTNPVQLLALIEGPLIFWNLIYSIKKNRDNQSELNSNSQLIILFGMLTFLLFILLDIARITTSKYFGLNLQSYTDASFITLGSVIFIACLLMRYIFYTLDNIIVEEQKIELESIAFYDLLTELSNRTRCEDILRSLDEIDEDYGILSVDLDHLKIVNDTYGHSVGDELLKTFSEILEEIFPYAILVGRMGGDEFIVILDEEDTTHINELTDALVERVDEQNLIEVRFQYSFSFGFATHKEHPNKTAQELYLLADERMYRQKALHHIQDTKGGECS